MTNNNMTIREKIHKHAYEQSVKDHKYFNRALIRMAGIIFAGYIVGTVIAFFIQGG